MIEQRRQPRLVHQRAHEVVVAAMRGTHPLEHHLAHESFEPLDARAPHLGHSAFAEPLEQSISSEPTGACRRHLTCIHDRWCYCKRRSRLPPAPPRPPPLRDSRRLRNLRARFAQSAPSALRKPAQLAPFEAGPRSALSAADGRSQPSSLAPLVLPLAGGLPVARLRRGARRLLQSRQRLHLHELEPMHAARRRRRLPGRRLLQLRRRRLRLRPTLRQVRRRRQSQRLRRRRRRRSRRRRPRPQRRRALGRRLRRDRSLPGRPHLSRR